MEFLHPQIFKLAGACGPLSISGRSSVPRGREACWSDLQRTGWKWELLYKSTKMAVQFYAALCSVGLTSCTAELSQPSKNIEGVVKKGR